MSGSEVEDKVHIWIREEIKERKRCNSSGK
jgi:hypothetical protein